MIRQLLTLLALSLAAGAACAGEFCDEYGEGFDPNGAECRIDLEAPPPQNGELQTPPPVVVRTHPDPLQRFSVCPRWPTENVGSQVSIIEFAFAPADGTAGSQVLAVGVVQSYGQSYLVVDWVVDSGSGWTQGGSGLLPPTPVALIPIGNCDSGQYSEFSVSLTPDRKRVLFTQGDVVRYRSPRHDIPMQPRQLRVAPFATKNAGAARFSTGWPGLQPNA